MEIGVTGYDYSKIQLLAAVTELLQGWLASRFGVDTHRGLGGGQAVADPRSVAKDEFQSLGADDLAYRMAAEFGRIGLQPLSGLCLDLGRQSETLPLRIEGTYFVTDDLQLLAQRLSPSGYGFRTEQSGEDTVLLWNVMTDRQASALFTADHDLVREDEFADILESDGSLVEFVACSCSGESYWLLASRT